MRRNGGRYSDWCFSNGKDFDGVREQLGDLRAIAAEAGRTDGPRFGFNGFVIVRDTESEARDTLREIVAKAHVEAVEGFGAAVKQAGQSTQDKKGMWADSGFEDRMTFAAAKPHRMRCSSCAASRSLMEAPAVPCSETSSWKMRSISGATFNRSRSNMRVVNSGRNAWAT